MRPSGTPAGAFLQPSDVATLANTAITAKFDLGNNSAVRKRVTAILHDLDFTDLQVCTFWLDPNQPLTSYTMVTFTGRAWANTTISYYMGNVDVTPWALLDNVSLKRTPSAAVLGTQCIMGASGSGAAALMEPPATPVSTDSGAAATAATTGTTQTSTTTATTATTSTGTPNRTTGLTNLDGGQVWRLDSGSLSTLVWIAPIDLRQASAPYLRFQSFVQAISSVAEVQVSADGAAWTAVGEVPAGDGWLTTDIDLSAYTGQVIYVRFVLRPKGSVVDGSTDLWYITDAWLSLFGLKAGGVPQ